MPVVTARRIGTIASYLGCLWQGCGGLLIKHLHIWALCSWWADGVGGVAGYDLPADRLFQGGMENAKDMQDSPIRTWLLPLPRPAVGAPSRRASM